jgi:hypothetical protein
MLILWLNILIDQEESSSNVKESDMTHILCCLLHVQVILQLMVNQSISTLNLLLVSWPYFLSVQSLTITVSVVLGHPL